MNDNIKFENKVYTKNEYTKLIDTNFSELGVSSIQDQIEKEPTVDEFFDLYERLFYSIPITGNNSHETLIQQSSEYINFEPNNEEILALQNEISQLRTELLQEQKEKLELQTGTSIDVPTVTPGNTLTPGNTTTTTGNSY